MVTCGKYTLAVEQLRGGITKAPAGYLGNNQIAFFSFLINRSLSRAHRLIPIHETGWKSFDVTQAVHYWSKTQQKTPMHLEVWIEGERPGSYAAEVAKSVRFTTQEQTDNTLGKPELILYTLNLEEYG